MNYVIIVIVIICVLYFFMAFNNLVKLKNNVSEAFSTMDVYLKKRWDLIPNLVEIVKGYSKHESNTLKEVIKLRNVNYDSMNMNDKINTNEKVNQGLTNIMMLVEKYPDLKANENYMSLSKDLTKVEEDIAQARKYYNAVVRDYNNKVEMIPSNIVALIIGYKKMNMFNIVDEEKNNVKVEL